MKVNESIGNYYATRWAESTKQMYADKGKPGNSSWKGNG